MMNLQDFQDATYAVPSVHADERLEAGSILVSTDIRYGARDRKTVAIQLVDDEGNESPIITVYASDLLRAVKAAKADTL